MKAQFIREVRLPDNQSPTWFGTEPTSGGDEREPILV